MRLKTFTPTNFSGQIPKGVWVAFYREEDDKWIAHCLKEAYNVNPVCLLSTVDHDDLSYQRFSYFKLCGWSVARTDDADYPLIIFDTAGSHFFPYPCENDPNGTMNAPKDELLMPAWKRRQKQNRS